MSKAHKKNQSPAVEPASSSRASGWGWPLLACCLLLLALGIWLVQVAKPQAPAAPLGTTVQRPMPVKHDGKLVDERQCQGCHAEQFAQWQGSHHQLAMQEASDTSVLGDFNNVSFKSDSETTRFFRKGREFWIHAPGADGQPQDFRVAYAFGIEPLQQYLIDTGKGHLQALGVAWDTQKKSWFHLYPGQCVDFRDPLHWSTPQQNANFMCVECHTTGYQRNYNSASNTYSSAWHALGVGCQSCHGPASNHLAWTREPQGWSNAGFSQAAHEKDNLNEVETCARCHSRRANLGDGFRSHLRLMDDYLPSVLAPVLYEIDGKIKDEVFEYGSFTQSKMFAKGVRCSSCHNPHSAKLRQEGNELCTQCHNPSGQAAQVGIAGQGLLAKNYDSPEHHRHPAGSPAAQCTSCHMPGKLYMVNDYRHDHSFSLPNPERALKLGTPDACIACHTAMPSAKLAEQFQQWFAQLPTKEPRYDEALLRIRQGSHGAAAALLEQLARQELPAIRRATLLAEVANYPGQPLFQAAINDLRHTAPQVREAAVSAVAALQPQRVDILGPLLDDPVRAVRINAGFQLLGLSPPQLGPYAEAWRKAIGEYEQVQASLAERAESHLNLAMLYQADGRSGLVEPALRTALKRDPDFLPARIALAQWLENNAQVEQGRQLLQESLHQHADSALLQHAWGLALVRTGEHAQALHALAQAAQLEPDNPEYGYVYAIALHDTGKGDLAREQLQALLARQPSNRAARFALMNYLKEVGQDAQARQLAAELALINPADPALR
ncbi:tetratricopeptide repeat protein [Pseudomonas sp. J452]|uniref:multiheme c-type cytochrome n=1 Tax=Pseudomonas sp. J452 TaxID=2898441 RepID=UPI0021AE02AF|nr:tetratricopeptide repeat protein [Pseudomonas sp. J452]UUY06783.1 tetratricopeptide repeat protein [Pseudomonas sp. J452]